MLNHGGVQAGVQAGVVGRVEAKLLSFPKVEGIVFGNWGEASEATHKLVDMLATSRARVAEPQTSRRGGESTSSQSYQEDTLSSRGQGPVLLPAW